MKAIFLAAVFSLSGLSSHALIITGGATSTEGLGAFTGTFDYTASSATSAQVEINLTNTTLTAGGFLTALAFNNPNDYITSSTLTVTGNSNFSILPADGNIISTGDELKGNPYGDFDIGAAATNSWISGGSPNGGLAVNDTATFTFDLTGSNLDTLTADSFFQTLSSGNAGEGNQAFAVRFRGMTEGAGSDKVIGAPAVPVPEPSTFALFGMACFMFGLVAYRKRNKKS